LASYEKALKAIAGTLERGPGSSDIDWISNLATTQAKFIRDVTAAWIRVKRAAGRGHQDRSSGRPRSRGSADSGSLTLSRKMTGSAAEEKRLDERVALLDLAESGHVVRVGRRWLPPGGEPQIVRIG
jgi:hypothetical protein